MKKLLIIALALSLIGFARAGAQSAPYWTGTDADARSGSKGTGYAPNNGTANPGNPGTGLRNAAPANTGPDQSTTIKSSSIDPRTEQKENLDRANTSVNPVPEDTDDLTLQGKTQTGPYRTPANRQQQESNEEDLDNRAIPKVDHSEKNDLENQ